MTPGSQFICLHSGMGAVGSIVKRIILPVMRGVFEYSVVLIGWSRGYIGFGFSYILSLCLSDEIASHIADVLTVGVGCAIIAALDPTIIPFWVAGLVGGMTS